MSTASVRHSEQSICQSQSQCTHVARSESFTLASRCHSRSLGRAKLLPAPRQRLGRCLPMGCPETRGPHLQALHACAAFPCL